MNKNIKGFLKPQGNIHFMGYWETIYTSYLKKKDYQSTINIEVSIKMLGAGAVR